MRAAIILAVCSLLTAFNMRGGTAVPVTVDGGASAATRSVGLTRDVVAASTAVASMAATPEHSLTYAQWFESTPRQVVEPVAFEFALRRRGWPQSDAERMTNAAEQCESPAYDASGKLIGIDLWRTVTDSDGFPTIGPGIHPIAHPDIDLSKYDLHTLAGVTDVMTIIRSQAIAAWGSDAGLRPWGCAR